MFKLLSFSLLSIASARTLRTSEDPAPVKIEDMAKFVGVSAKSEEASAKGGPVDWPPAGIGDKPKTPGQFVPFGKAIPRQNGVTYYTATGLQECMACKAIIANAYTVGPQFYELANAAYPERVDMLHAQQKTLQACPEFANDWCYQDLGGSQQLRAPCPDHLKCHYCLGLNPLHCIEDF